MNPLTLVKRIQSINSKEAELGISDDASWHAKYKDSAYVFTGGIPYDLTEGDLLAVFAQAADTGWGHEEDKKSKWENDKYDFSRDNKRSRGLPPSRGPDQKQPDGSSRGKFNIETTHRPSGGGSIDPQDTRDRGKLSGYREDHDKRAIERRSSKSRDDYDRRDEKKSRRHDSIPSMTDSRDRDRERTRDEEKRSSYSRDSSPRRHRDRDDDHHRARRDENYRSRRL